MAPLPFIGRLQVIEYLSLFFSLTLIGTELVLRLITMALPSPLIRLGYALSERLFACVVARQGTENPRPEGGGDGETPESSTAQADRNGDQKPAAWPSTSDGSKDGSRRAAHVRAIAEAGDFDELCAIFGYDSEEHLVQTQDGYMLGIHRLCWPRAECRHQRAVRLRRAAQASAGAALADQSGRSIPSPPSPSLAGYNIDDVDDGDDGLRPVNSGHGSVQKKVVYLHHGLMMSSDVWVCLTDRQRCLPFELVERGYDVWLGNNRGNKYSKKSFRHSPSEDRFWDFSIDEFAFFDIPDTINYILATTGQASLSYIGFSQGSAQAFAALSVHPELNNKIDVFIALAPALAPPGLTSSVVNSLVQASPQVLFLAFGRRTVLGSAVMWQALLYPPVFVRLIDWAVGMLFAWKMTSISAEQKLAAYAHVYDHSSTRTVVHWFQIIRSGTFQMFDDEMVPARLSGWLALATSVFRPSAPVQFSRPTKYPTRNIRTPIVLVYGGSDGLVDPTVMRRELPPSTVAIEVPHYEHLDFLWGDDVDRTVFPHVFKTLERYAGTAASLTVASPVQTSHMTGHPSRVRGGSLSSSGGMSSSSPSPYRHSLLGHGYVAPAAASTSVAVDMAHASTASIGRRIRAE